MTHTNLTLRNSSNEPAPRRSGPQPIFIGLGTMFGWLTAAASAVALWIFLMPSDQAATDCQDVCFSEQGMAAIIAIVFGGAALVVAVIVGAVLTGVRVRRGASGWRAGTLAAAVGLSTGILLIGTWLMTR
jgi:hypothetical protein